MSVVFSKIHRSSHVGYEVAGSTESSISQTKRLPLKAIVLGGNAGSAKTLQRVLEQLPTDTPPLLVANGTIAPFLECF